MLWGALTPQCADSDDVEQHSDLKSNAVPISCRTRFRDDGERSRSEATLVLFILSKCSPSVKKRFSFHTSVTTSATRFLNVLIYRRVVMGWAEAESPATPPWGGAFWGRSVGPTHDEQTSLWIGSSVFSLPLAGTFFSHRFAFQLDPMSVVHQSVQDAISHRGFADLGVPSRDRKLTRE